MRGLLIKDYRLLWNQRRTLGIMMLIWSNDFTSEKPFLPNTVVIAAVNVVLPWST